MNPTHRRQFLHLAAGAVLPTVPRVARAQSYPTRPVRLVVPFPAGGGGDIPARLLSQWLSERLGQPFVVENRPGAAGNIGTETVVKAVPDGYTLLYTGANNMINTSLYDTLTFDFVRDIAPVASIMRVPGVMEVNPSVPAKTVPEFIAFAKANPGKISMASGGNGSPPHLYGELFKRMAGIDMVHVPYRGTSLALPDLLNGRVQVLFDLVTTAMEQIASGKLRALGVTTATRLAVLPNVPTIADFLPGYEASGVQGVGAPKNTPAETIIKLNTEINAALVDPRINARLSDQGGIVIPGSPTDFGKLIADETEKWAKVVKVAGIKPD